MNNLKNKNTLITGAGKGIGKAVAIALAKEGVNAYSVKSLTLTADVAEMTTRVGLSVSLAII